MSTFDPVHIDSSHPCIPHLIEAADALAKAAVQADTALEHLENSLTGVHMDGCEKCELWNAFANYEKARGMK